MATHLGIAQLEAAQISLRASISPETVRAGESANYQIQVSGESFQSAPPRVQAGNLKIHYLGPSKQMVWKNGVTSNLVAYVYSVSATGPGDYTIPPQQIKINGQLFETNPVTFKVLAPGHLRSSNAPGQAQNNGSPSYFAELVPDKKRLYVGEMVPVELRVYFEEQIGIIKTPEQLELKSEGFTTRDWEVIGKSASILKDGKRYTVFTYKTALAPVKSGKFTIDPISSEWVLNINESRGSVQSRGRSLWEDFFDDPFFNQGVFGSGPFAMRGAKGRFTVQTDPIQLEVLPLPDNHKPASFTGAVGSFNLTASVDNSTAKAGEPITLKMKIYGKGNFDRVSNPQVDIGSGQWQSYEPESNFVATDSLGFNGEKSFNQLIVPMAPADHLPPIEFSYFDPDEEHYVVLRPQPIEIKVLGSAAPTPPLAAQPAQTTPSSPTAGRKNLKSDAKQEAKKAGSDILYIATTYNGKQRSFKPLFKRPAFWLAQSIPLAALLSLAALYIYKLPDGRFSNARRRTYLKNKLSSLLGTLENTKSPGDQTYQAAYDYLDTSLRLAREHLDTTSCEESDILQACREDQALLDNVQKILDRKSELLYAGNTSTEFTLPPWEREDILATVQQFEKALEGSAACT